MDCADSLYGLKPGDTRKLCNGGFVRCYGFDLAIKPRHKYYFFEPYTRSWTERSFCNGSIQLFRLVDGDDFLTSQ